MLTAQSTKSNISALQPHSPVAAVDLTCPNTILGASSCVCLSTFFSKMITFEALSARVSFEQGETRYQLNQLSGVDEFREDNKELPEALSTLYALDPTATSDMGGLTLHVITDNANLDISLVHLDTAHGDQWIVRARTVSQVPVILDTLGLTTSELRHLRKALTEKRGLISIGTPHRLYLEDWHRAICRELCAPDKSVVSLVPRLLEELPRISQTILPPGDRWDQKLWQLASQVDADVIVLSDDGTHGYAPDQLGVLAEQCLVVQILQTPDIGSLTFRTPISRNVHRVLMHHPVRSLCPECKEPHNNPSRVDYGFLDRTLPTLSDGVNAWLSANQSTHFKKPMGCDACHTTGYSGELCVIDSIGDAATLMDAANSVDIHSIDTARTEKLVELASDGLIGLDEAKRLVNT